MAKPIRASGLHYPMIPFLIYRIDFLADIEIDRNFMLNFKLGEYMGKMFFFFKSVTQATGNKKTPPQNKYHHVSILRISTYRNSRLSSMLDVCHMNPV